ncbi:MAG: hypothetical protein H0X34_19920 [Chthoniobacterales bacterium]|nr:hypothetical protein [Chthoniobacterales bacterium]
MTVPTWATGLFPHIELTKDQLSRLESIRLDAGVSDESMELHIQTHPECTKMLQRKLFWEIKDSNPSAPDEMILMHLFYSRLLTAKQQGFGLLGVSAKDVTDKANPPRSLLEAIHAVMIQRDMRTVDDFADAVVKDEESIPSIVPTSPSLEWVADRIAAVLQEKHPRSTVSHRVSE